MPSATEYAQMTSDELASEEKALKSGKINTALFVGLLTGIAVWSATHRKPLLTFILLACVLLIGKRFAANAKSLQEELDRRNRAG